MKFPVLRSMLLLQIAAVFTLIGLAFMVWSMFVPTVWPVILAMSVGQGFGTLAFGAYLFVVLRDIRRQMKAKKISAGNTGQIPVVRDSTPEIES